MDEKSLDKEIGEKLRKHRDEKKLTMREVASKLDINFSYISRIENGYIPSMKVLRELADLYDIKVSELFGEEIEVPEELKEVGVDWITFAKDMKKEDMTPEKVKEYVEIVKRIQKNL